MQEPAFAHYFDVAFDIVTIGTSLGGLNALSRLLAGLPADFPAPIVVVQHLASNSPTFLPELLGRRTRLRVSAARDGQMPRPGAVYVAPPGRHVLVGADGTLLLSDGPKVAFARPAADPLFESAAAAFGRRTLAVMLTGQGTDGVAGVRAVKSHGGTVIVQDRATSQAFSMPEAAIATGCVDFVLPLSKIAPALTALVMVRGAATLFGVAVPAPVPLAG